MRGGVTGVFGKARQGMGMFSPLASRAFGGGLLSRDSPLLGLRMPSAPPEQSGTVAPGVPPPLAIPIPAEVPGAAPAAPAPVQPTPVAAAMPEAPQAAAADVIGV